MVIRVLSVPDYLDLPGFDEVFRTILGWDGLGFILRVHGQEYNSFRRRARSKNTARLPTAAAGKVPLHLRSHRPVGVGSPASRQRAGHRWRDSPICIGGRGAAPPEYCGGPTGYRLMLKRQREGKSMCAPAQVEAVIEMLSASDPDVPASMWDLLRRTCDDGMTSIDKRLEQYGPLDPECFSLKDVNQRLAKRAERGRFLA
jgi:hypothetical protein